MNHYHSGGIRSHISLEFVFAIALVAGLGFLVLSSPRANAAECVPSPRSHLVAEDILVSGGVATGKIKNTSPDCSYSVGLASYRVYASRDASTIDYLNTQELHDKDIRSIAPGASVTLSVNLPGCDYQVDLFEGSYAPVPPDFELLPDTHTLFKWYINRALGVCVHENNLPIGYHEAETGSVPEADCKASGWAADPDSKDKDLLINIYSDGRLVAKTFANLYRRDLQDAGVCTRGTCAFVVNLADIISPNVPHVIRVKARDAQTLEEVDLTWTPKKLTCTAPVQNEDPSPVVDIRANNQNGPITIPSGTGAVISWTSSNATACTVSPSGWTGISGSQSSGNLTASRTYSVTCTGPGGTATDSVTVNVSSAPQAPTADIKANGSDGPVTIAYDTAANLSWTSSNATSCSVSLGAFSGTLGSVSTGNLVFSQTYQLTCTGPGGTATDSVGVNIASQQSAPTVDIKANGSDGTVTLGYNASAFVTWTSSNASVCNVFPFGGTGTSGSYTETPGNSRTYSVTCTGPGGTANDSVTVNVNQPLLPTVNLTASQHTITQGNASLLSWTSSNADSCSVSGGWTGGRFVNGYENVYPQFTTTYVITCVNSFGVAQDTETVGVLPVSNNPSNLFITKRGLNRTLNQSATNSFFEAQGGDVIEFEIRVRNTDIASGVVTVRDALPQEFLYINGSTRLDGVFVQDGIIGSGISLGIVQPNQERLVTFQVRVLLGTTPRTVVNVASASMNSGIQTSTATITIRNRGQVLGAADVVTGPEDILPLVLLFGFASSLMSYYYFFARREGWGFGGILRMQRIRTVYAKQDVFKRKFVRAVAKIKEREPYGGL